MFKVGQKVWCAIYGAGVVAEIHHASEGVYPVEVEFNNGHSGIYTNDGKYYSVGNITLFPYPVEIVKAITKPSIDWSHVSEYFQYLAMDEDGRCWLWVSKPAPFQDEWNGRGVTAKAENFASFISGTCDWKDSLVERPE